MSDKEKNIIDQTDDEILPIANRIWSDLLKASNDGNYGEFIRYFAYSLIKGLNEIEVGKQFVILLSLICFVKYFLVLGVKALAIYQN